MDDLLFLKRLDTTHWLGLRMPPDLTIVAGTDNKGVLDKPWTLNAPPEPEWPDAVYYGPAAEEDADDISLTWKAVPWVQFTGPAFAGVLADLELLPVAEDKKSFARQQLTESGDKAGVSLPLRAYQAYIQTQGDGTSAHLDLEGWRDLVLAALSERPGKLPIEAFGGLLFLVKANAAPVPKDGVFIDAEEPSTTVPSALQVKAFQHSKGVAFECADAADGKAFTNSSVLKAVDGTIYSGYYRITRTLGVVERPSRRGALVAIPTQVDDAPGWKVPAEGMPAKEPWEQRRFRLTDSLAPDELIGELLNYRIEFFNPHGRQVRAGRVMLQRRRLDPPAAITRAMARLVAPLDDTPALTIRFDLPPTEKPDGTDLELVLYRLENPVLPTGFYGDADDAAVQVARLLSDIDPAAFMDVRAGDQVLTGPSSESAQAHLSNHGLTPFASIPLKPAPTDTSAPPVETQPGPRRLPAPKPGDDSLWSQYGWEVSVESLETLLPDKRAVRLMISLRRVASPNVAGAVIDGPAPESPVLEPQLLIGFHTTSTERDLVIPHFERFWTDAPVNLAPLDEDRVYFTEADMPAEKPPDHEADDRARVRMQVQHLSPDMDLGAELIGGYRVWMRDLPARHAQGYPFEALAVVQAVPQLVKAYAPIEMGRQWWAEIASNTNGKATDVPDEKIFLASPSPQAIVRNKAKEEPGPTVAQVVAQLNKLLTGSSEERAPKQDVRSGALLLQFWRLLDPGLCKEVILSIAQRRELTRYGAAWLDDKPGNWILFCDQNGGYLGRAWTFSGDLAASMARIHVLHEVPNTEDTVAVDDFGQMTWNWAGLQDAWHHELEWVVEPLSRYAPLRQRRLPPPASAPGERPKVEPRHAVPPWQKGLAGTPATEASVHRLAILRRMPFGGRVGLIPLPDPEEEDAFVWQVNLPPEFRRATHNTHARTALGTLRLEVIQASAKTLLDKDFARAEIVDPLIESWCARKTPETSATPETLESLEIGHQLVIHQPACFEVMLKVQPRADTKAGEPTQLEQPAQRAPRKDFPNIDAVPADHCYAHEEDKELVIPLARLSWSYKGSARPTVEDVIGREIHSTVAPLPGLRLPDPAASATVFVNTDGVLRPCAYFFGPSVTKDTEPSLEAQPNWTRESSTTVRWGVAYRDTEVLGLLTLLDSGPHPGDLVLSPKVGQKASELRVLWKRGGGSSDLQTPPKK